MNGKPQRPSSAEASACTCETPEEHKAMLARLDESYKKEDERAAERFARNTAFLRQQTLEGNKWEYDGKEFESREQAFEAYREKNGDVQT